MLHRQHHLGQARFWPELPMPGGLLRSPSHPCLHFKFQSCLQVDHVQRGSPLAPLALGPLGSLGSRGLLGSLSPLPQLSGLSPLARSLGSLASLSPLAQLSGLSPLAA